MNHRPRILVVDDDSSEQALVEAIAARGEAEIIWCAAGEDGLARASSEPFDAILLDILRADRSGYEICRKLKSNPETADVPLLFLTSRGREEDLLAGFEALAFDFLVKPYHPRELRTRIQNALRQKALRDELQTLALFSECYISLCRALDEADSPETARREGTRLLESIAGVFHADGIAFTLEEGADLLACGSLAGAPAAEAPVQQRGIRARLRLFRGLPCDAEESLRLNDLASLLGRGIRRFLPPAGTPSSSALD